MKSFADKVVVITGAGGGMGREMALYAAREGALLAISDWNAEALEQTVALVKAANAKAVRSDVVDVSDRRAVGSWAAAVAEQFGTVNVVVNNAGVTLTGDFEDMSYEDFDWIVGVNFHGVVNGTKEFLPHLITSGDGVLVNISSMFGLFSMPGQSAYNATKYAVRGLTEALREEMLINKHNVSVTCMHPGSIKTDIARNGRKTAGQDAAKIDEMFETKTAITSAQKAAKIILDGAKAKKARVLVGIDAHLLHHAAKLAGSRYQDVVAALAPKLLPQKVVNPPLHPVK